MFFIVKFEHVIAAWNRQHHAPLFFLNTYLLVICIDPSDFWVFVNVNSFMEFQSLETMIQEFLCLLSLCLTSTVLSLTHFSPFFHFL